ncbi:MAG: DUF167 domain-containing protein [Thermomicrobiales bacterium]
MDAFDRINLTGTDGAARLVVRVVPRADRNAIDGVTETGAVRVRLTTPPVEGAANAALIALLADLLAIPKRDIAITRGERGREKVVQIALPLAAIRARLRAATDRKSR